MVAKTAISIENPDSPTVSSHKNKLTQCFDDLMRLSTEMLVQEQLKTIQLDNNITNGFTTTQQRNLKEKVHIFHGILDDLDITLNKCSDYIETVNKIGIEKKEAKQIELKRLKEEQEKEQKLKKEKQQELKHENGTHDTINIMDDMKLSFNDDDGSTNDIFNSFNNDSNGKDTGILTASTGTNISDPTNSSSSLISKNIKNKYKDNNNNNNSSSNSIFNDLDTMDMSLFTDLDNTNFDALSGALGATNDSAVTTDTKGNSTSINTKNQNNSDTNTTAIADELGLSNNNDNNNSSINSKNTANATNDNINLMDPIQDMADDYLTLNDFNDLNIDWSAGGDSGELDLNNFNM